MTDPPIDETGHKGGEDELEARTENTLINYMVGESERTAFTEGFNACLDLMFEEFEDEGIELLYERLRAMRKGR